MIRELVPFKNGFYLRVDAARLRRKAIVLLKQIEDKVDRQNDVYRFYSFTMPWVKAAIAGEIVEPLDENPRSFINANFIRDEQEGDLPPEYDGAFSSAVAGFVVAAQALSLEKTPELTRDGITYRWRDTEEEGDWPDKIKFP